MKYQITNRISLLTSTLHNSRSTPRRAKYHGQPEQTTPATESKRSGPGPITRLSTQSTSPTTQGKNTTNTEKYHSITIEYSSKNLITDTFTKKISNNTNPHYRSHLRGTKHSSTIGSRLQKNSTDVPGHGSTSSNRRQRSTTPTSPPRRN